MCFPTLIDVLIYLSSLNFYHVLQNKTNDAQSIFQLNSVVQLQKQSKTEELEEGTVLKLFCFTYMYTNTCTLVPLPSYSLLFLIFSAPKDNSSGHSEPGNALCSQWMLTCNTHYCKTWSEYFNSWLLKSTDFTPNILTFITSFKRGLQFSVIVSFLFPKQRYELLFYL